MKAAALFLAAALTAGTVAADDEPIMPASASVAGRDLVLNGRALRSVWGFRVYEVGLFLGERNTDATSIMNGDRSPKRVRMNMLRSVDKEKFVATVRENIDGNFTPPEKERFASELEAFVGYLESGGDIEPGHVITIDYVPGEGTLLGLDGRHLGTIAGDDFYHCVLRLWIGQPLQASIKDGLLGATSGD
jgi:hypothetical protein